ncbi:MAG: hypothetical protein ABGY75_11380 [Gemmataceae bacterium]
MSAFMTLVERAVRPVLAGPTRKLRMREELLAHLEGVYAEELARLGDEPAARAEAARRFGDPAALTADLQQSVSFRERLDGRINRLFGGHPGEPPVRMAGRAAGLVAVLISGWLVLTLTATAVRRPDDCSIPTAAQLLRLFGALLVFAPLAVFLLTLLFVRTRDALHGPFAAPRSWRRAIGFAALAFLVVPLTGTAFYWVGVPGIGEVAAELTTPFGVMLSIVYHLSVPLALLGFAWKTGPTAARHRTWAALDIG